MSHLFLSLLTGEADCKDIGDCTSGYPSTDLCLPALDYLRKCSQVGGLKLYRFSCHSIKALKLVPNQRLLHTVSLSCALKIWLSEEGSYFKSQVIHSRLK
uniref:Uncharacterized protein n=1 Tax=Micrurus lemniscatus lemniscatus TaxID=129467 RepID=A0A2D4HCT2_MICLE